MSAQPCCTLVQNGSSKAAPSTALHFLLLFFRRTHQPVALVAKLRMQGDESPQLFGIPAVLRSKRFVRLPRRAGALSVCYTVRVGSSTQFGSTARLIYERMLVVGFV
jgi:hypothetical protein